MTFSTFRNTLQANPGGTNVEVLDEQAPDSTAVVDEAVRVFEKREVRPLHNVLVGARCPHAQARLQLQAPGKRGLRALGIFQA